MKRKPHADPVTEQVRLFVLTRDGGCVGAKLGATGACRDQWGNPLSSTSLLSLQLDHVNDEPTFGKRAPSDPAHLVAICAFHHLQGWATSHRPLLRTYLARVANGRADGPLERQRVW